MPDGPADGTSRLSALAAVLRGNLGYLFLLFAGVLVPLWLFAELADEFHELEAQVFDDALLLRLKSWASPAADRVFVWISLAGFRYGVIPVDILLSLALLAFRRWREAVFAMVAFAGSALLNVAAKQSFRRERPSLWESIAPETTFSFPSGHAMGSMTLAAVVVLLAWRTRWRWPVLVLAVAFTGLVGLSRLYLGVHYPSDVLAGWAAGLAWTAGVYLVLFRYRRPWQDGSRWRYPAD
ncbi:phosphatase PAP2 family protein [Pseudoxanthomonas suwonensis]|uniref:undecaprenyl-diphosphate phosphatase n=1 Tax=Pseudoxanthomonas suwonensis TaxID=314722 RepID=A0A0E3YZB9_9GAMM|nr:phosphatase PAP2 family protein [Pseudoxanthomonas suwonensis]AKC85478.1 membrane protein [Pseudoxanthomonas suwonensis]